MVFVRKRYAPPPNTLPVLLLPFRPHRHQPRVRDASLACGVKGHELKASCPESSFGSNVGENKCDILENTPVYSNVPTRRGSRTRRLGRGQAVLTLPPFSPLAPGKPGNPVEPWKRADRRRGVRAGPQGEPCHTRSAQPRTQPHAPAHPWVPHTQLSL